MAHQSRDLDVTFKIIPTGQGSLHILDVEASYSGGRAQGKGEDLQGLVLGRGRLGGGALWADTREPSVKRVA